MATVAIFTFIGFGAVMLLELFLQFHFAGPDYQLPRRLIAPILLAAAAPGFLFGLWFAKKMLNKQYWQLTDAELSCGIFRQQIFPLDSIEKIIVGLPVNAVEKLFQRAQPGTATGTTVDVLAKVDPMWNTARSLWQTRAIKENSLLICFKDGSCLPLRLFALPNGTAIINELKERCRDRLVQDYTYSAEEIRRLRKRDVNELIPAPKQSKRF
ncbi:MAG: hypothetical protein WAO02_12195 [Verrucomicrobiia bacterium]